ncbi:MAG: four helix bundle protein [Ardenticatenaceae bacterium]|nr:four helix bundle protein [Anaerolineales bacterium]MCB8922020.1 four helix bundle protein [Ardenticatenaceae bacterium]MCB8989596.1 four helix bundle protein [Ardenticatenaceae bacterium]MCB9003139.1 four helix bundle protein [Ardenticatenaceae bacterium]
MRDYKQFLVWQKGHELTLAIYKNTEGFPKQEQYGLTSQIRRAAYSIPANIAEGAGRISETEFARFLEIALGSANEVSYFFLLAHDLNYFQTSIYHQLSTNIDEIQRMLRAFITKLKAKS